MENTAVLILSGIGTVIGFSCYFFLRQLHKKISPDSFINKPIKYRRRKSDIKYGRRKSNRT